MRARRHRRGVLDQALAADFADRRDDAVGDADAKAERIADGKHARAGGRQTRREDGRWPRQTGNVEQAQIAPDVRMRHPGDQWRSHRTQPQARRAVHEVALGNDLRLTDRHRR